MCLGFHSLRLDGHISASGIAPLPKRLAAWMTQAVLRAGSYHQSSAQVSDEEIRQYCNYYLQQGYTQEQVQDWVRQTYPDSYESVYGHTPASVGIWTQAHPQQQEDGSAAPNQDAEGFSGVTVGLHYDAEGAAMEGQPATSSSVAIGGAQNDSAATESGPRSDVAEQGSTRGDLDDLQRAPVRLLPFS